MRRDAIQLEETRLKNVQEIEDYNALHERHRIFPSIFENRKHEKILDISAGVGIVGKRIQDYYKAQLLCNDVSPKCLKSMTDIGLSTTSFDIDDPEKPFPFPDEQFDAVICLATLEHLIHIDHFLKETFRIICDSGYLYLSTPNYSGLPYLLPFLISGKTFHNPLSESDRYEFYAHVRYFTYRTLLELVSTFGFKPDSVYLALPQNSTRYQSLLKKSKFKALAIKYCMKFLYQLSPRWASEPVICFNKASDQRDGTIRKVIL